MAEDFDPHSLYAEGYLMYQPNRGIIWGLDPQVTSSNKITREFPREISILRKLFLTRTA